MAYVQLCFPRVKCLIHPVKDAIVETSLSSEYFQETREIFPAKFRNVSTPKKSNKQDFVQNW